MSHRFPDNTCEKKSKNLREAHREGYKRGFYIENRKFLKPQLWPPKFKLIRYLN